VIGRRRAAWLGAVAVLVLTAQVAHGYARPGGFDRVSVATNGAQANGGGRGDAPAITPDGRYVAFTSSASNLVPGDTNNAPDVFVRDRRTGKTVRVSVATGGAQGQAKPVLCGTLPVDVGVGYAGGASEPAISANGRYVAFMSCFDNLVAGDTNLLDDIFVHDLRTGTTVRVSVDSHGKQANGSSEYPALSADGQKVSFDSAATNLDPTHQCGSAVGTSLVCATQPYTIGTLSQMFVHDRVHGSTAVVSVSSTGELSDGQSGPGTISRDGRYVAFTSEGDNLSPQDTSRCAVGLIDRQGYPSCPDVYLHDLVTHQTRLVSVGLDGKAAESYRQPGNGESGTRYAAEMISGDDRYVAFRSDDDNLVPNSGGTYGIYVWDRTTGRVRRASVGSDGNLIETGQDEFAFGADGRYVAFSNVPMTCPNGTFLSTLAMHDMTTGATQNVIPDATNCAGQPLTNTPVLTDGGREVAFWSSASNLVSHDTNGHDDVFVRDEGSSLGVGDLAAAGRLSVAGAGSFRTTDSVVRTDAYGDVAPALTNAGLDLIGATVTYRPGLADLFARLELARMPLFDATLPGLLYGLDFSVDGTAYQLRIAKTGATASFQLYRMTKSATWTHVASLHGGYGTTGQEVVVAIPLDVIGARSGGRIGAASAFAGYGTTLAGPADIVDTVAL
jgi:Tol biopolymer transport system component